ncbi:MAG: SDR family oxidoreductase [Chloracidobacterium sp.]|nr:SDR family oxidoreductase [Chloracidobacterium sp.]
MERCYSSRGASSGIGRGPSSCFRRRDWKVAATMRSPEASEDAREDADVECFRLDVTGPASSRKHSRTLWKSSAGLTFVVNNAGYGLWGRLRRRRMSRSGDSSKRTFLA